VRNLVDGTAQVKGVGLASPCLVSPWAVRSSLTGFPRPRAPRASARPPSQACAGRPAVFSSSRRGIRDLPGHHRQIPSQIIAFHGDQLACGRRRR